MKKNNKTLVKPQLETHYKTSLSFLDNTVTQANKFHAEGYVIKWCFPVVYTKIEEGKEPENVQAIWMMAEKVEYAATVPNH